MVLCKTGEGGNRVAHDLAHLLPFTYGRRLWDGDIPNSVVARASDDMCSFIDSSLIK